MRGVSPRAKLAAWAVSLLLILVYYVAQTFAQFLYTAILLVGDVVRLSRRGLPIADLDFDIWHLREKIQSQYTVIAAIYGLLLIAAYAMIIRARQRGRPSYVWLERPKHSHLLAATAVALGMLGTANLVFVALDGLANHIRVIGEWMSQYQAVVDLAFPAEAGVGWLILGVCFLVPIAEELLFRGLVLGELSAVMPPWLAVIAQALLFSIFHMQGIQSIYVFLPGLAMGIAYWTTRSIWVPIVMHVLFNFIGSGALDALTGGESALPHVLFVVLLGFVPIGLLCLIWLGKNRVTDEATAGFSQVSPQDPASEVRI